MTFIIRNSIKSPSTRLLLTRWWSMFAFLLSPETEFFYPEPLHGTHTIARETFELMDGVFSMAAEKLNFGAANANRALYFHALASDKEYSVPISALANRTAWTTDENAYTNAFRIVGTKGSQSAASTMDSNGNLFLSLNNINAIACWDISRKTFTQPSLKVLVRDDEKLQFQSGMKVVRNTDGEEELWIVTNRFQVSITVDMSWDFSMNFSTLCSRVFISENYDWHDEKLGC